jgi:hypothetical protein
MEFECDYSF